MIIDISGPDGNAMFLMGSVQRWCKQLDKDSKPIIADMMSGDYNHLIDVIEREFKYVVEIVGRDNDEWEDG